MTVLLEREMSHSGMTAIHMCQEQYSSLHHSGKEVWAIVKASLVLELVVVFPYIPALPLESLNEDPGVFSSGEACFEVLSVALRTMLRLCSDHCCDVRGGVEEPVPLLEPLTYLDFVSASFFLLCRAQVAL